MLFLGIFFVLNSTLILLPFCQHRVKILNMRSRTRMSCLHIFYKNDNEYEYEMDSFSYSYSLLVLTLSIKTKAALKTLAS